MPFNSSPNFTFSTIKQPERTTLRHWVEAIVAEERSQRGASEDLPGFVLEKKGIAEGELTILGRPILLKDLRPVVGLGPALPTSASPRLEHDPD